MALAHFHFIGDLNDFLSPDRRKNAADYLFKGSPAVKHLIEALGVPHTEVEHVQANGKKVSLGYHVQNEDNIQVFPFQASLSPVDKIAVNSSSSEALRFILDIHLGKLAVYLRMFGFDALYRNDYEDEELAQIAQQEGRILLTRDRRLLMRSLVTRGYCVRALDPRHQIVEVIQRFGLVDKIVPFQRCLRCNSPLQPIAKEAIVDRLEPLTRQHYHEFHICPRCNQIYWKGSHYEHMQSIQREVLRAVH